MKKNATYALKKAVNAALPRDVVFRLKKAANIVPPRLIYRQRKKNIYIFSTRRGGSTLIGELLSADPATRLVNEPYNLFGNQPGRRFKRTLLPNYPWSAFINLTDEEAERVVDYTRAIASGRYQELRIYPYATRTVLKITSKDLFDIVYQNLDGHFVYFTRHPIPQSLSVIRNGWDTIAHIYLRNEYFRTRCLNEDQVAFCEAVMQRNDAFEKAVLSWGLENLITFNRVAGLGDVLHLTYEELVLNPEHVIPYLAQALEIDHVARMFSVMREPSGSSTLSTGQTKEAIKRQNRFELIGRWQKQVDDRQIERAQDILTALEIDIYTADNPLPQPGYRLFDAGTTARFETVAAPGP